MNSNNKINPNSTVSNQQHNLLVQLGNLDFDIARLKHLRASNDEIHDLEQIWFDLIRQYENCFSKN